MNVNYPDSPDYNNLANLWLQAATEIDQKIETKQNLLNRTTELISRIENADRSIPHEEVSHICDRVLGEFNMLSAENQDSIAKFAATLGDTGYEYLHKLFQTIGNTQHLPNYFDPLAPINLPPDPPRNLFDRVIGSSVTLFKSFIEKKPLPAEGITNLGIKVKKSIALSEKPSKSLLELFDFEKGLQKKIFSNLDKPSKDDFEYASTLTLKLKQQQAIVRNLNSDSFLVIPNQFMASIKELIEFLGTENCKQVNHLSTLSFAKSGASKDLLDIIRQAFPNLVKLDIFKPLDDVLKGQKGFELLERLALSYGNSEQLDASSLTHISTLEICYFPKLTTIKDPQHFTSLSELSIEECEKLDMNFLKDIPSLKKVSILGATEFNLSGLANNSHVSELRLISFSPGCKNFDFLFEMPALKQLKYIRCWIPPEVIEKLLQKGVAISDKY